MHLVEHPLPELDLCRVRERTKSWSNSLPCEPTSITCPSSEERAARSASDRPEITAAWVDPSVARARRATIDSRTGFAWDGSSTIGESVPS